MTKKLNLFTDDNPETTLHGLGFKNKETAVRSIKRIETHFNKLRDQQQIPGNSPHNLRPRTFLSDNKNRYRFYQRQKMTRVIGLLNRAKSLVKRTHRPQKIKEFNQAIEVLEGWMDCYHSDSKLH
jgi:plasmid stabilization system protein ParE